MNGVTECLGNLRNEGKKTLSAFITAGFPELESTVPIVRGLAAAGADLVEIGIPFSDPVADGPVIQSSSERALRNGVTLNHIFAMIREIRTTVSVPLVLMGYSNPVFSYGFDRFLGECARTGVDGTIIADLPPEESEEYRNVAGSKNIAPIFLAAPTTDDDRLEMLDRISDGFLYCVSITGVTGQNTGAGHDSREFIGRARRFVHRNPLLVGFGISTPADARSMAMISDGVIVGSALIRAIGTGAPDPAAAAGRFIGSIRQALDLPYS